MEPNKIMIINEATWVASGTTTLGPGEGKVWKVKLKESALDGFSGTIRILDANGATQNYSIPGTSAASDVNSHANEEVWMMSGDTIVRWSEVAYVEIYEYTALDQRFFGVSSVDYTANYKAYNAIGPASAFFGQPFEILTLPIDYEGGHTDSGYTSTYYACPTEMYLAYVDKQGVEHPVVDTMGSNGYMNFATSTY
nr:hypothetical protein [bacterium]